MQGYGLKRRLASRSSQKAKTLYLAKHQILPEKRNPNMADSLTVLGIETSCDETAAAIVDSESGILSDVIISQDDEHAPYHGIVPEIAARSHADRLDGAIQTAMKRAGTGFAELSGVVATAGPGLLGGVLVGTVTAKSVALVHGLPYVGVNHLEAHTLVARLTNGVEFPFLALLVSGGHSMFVAIEGVGHHKVLGATLDDAAGEAFDKAARLLGLGFPGGPAIERRAVAGDPNRFALPRPLLGREGANLSFSGLKTALLHTAEILNEEGLDEQTISDLAACFQAAVADVLSDRLANAAHSFRQHYPQGENFVLAGGVAANAVLRKRLEATVREYGLEFAAPPARLCTDNAAMVAWAGIEHLKIGVESSLDDPARARWPLGETNA